MNKIIPHLWFDKEAVEAANFYTAVFPDSKITSINKITDTPSGDCDIVSFNIMGLPFQAISAGPLFKFNPSISFMVNFDPSQDADARSHIDEIYEKLSEGGKVLMPLDKYDFSERYAWIQDKYGLTWQLIFTNPQGEMRPRIIPSMMFTGSNCGKAEEATNYYLSLFKDTARGTIARYPKGMEPNIDGSIMFTDFKLAGQWFAAMDSAGEHNFSFNEAVSLIVNCETQEEIDHFWENLSAVPEAEQCGWLKDKYGVSWQIVPTMMGELMKGGDKEKVARVTKAFLKMKKFDIAELRSATEGN